MCSPKPREGQPNADAKAKTVSLLLSLTIILDVALPYLAQGLNSELNSSKYHCHTAQSPSQPHGSGSRNAPRCVTPARAAGKETTFCRVIAVPIYKGFGVIMIGQKKCK